MLFSGRCPANGRCLISIRVCLKMRCSKIHLFIMVYYCIISSVHSVLYLIVILGYTLFSDKLMLICWRKNMKQYETSWEFASSNIRPLFTSIFPWKRLKRSRSFLIFSPFFHVKSMPCHAPHGPCHGPNAQCLLFPRPRSSRVFSDVCGNKVGNLGK